MFWPNIDVASRTAYAIGNQVSDCYIECSNENKNDYKTPFQSTLSCTKQCIVTKIMSGTLNNIEKIEKNPEIIKMGLDALKGIIDNQMRYDMKYGVNASNPPFKKLSNENIINDRPVNENNLKFRKIPVPTMTNTNQLIY
jgi:hypothetical protein